MKKRISWGILLWAAFLILVTTDIKNLRYTFHFIKELRKLYKKSSRYTEDSGWILVRKHEK